MIYRALILFNLLKQNDKFSFREYFSSLNYNIKERNDIMFLHKKDNNK